MGCMIQKIHRGFEMNEDWPYSGGIYCALSSGSTGLYLLIVMSRGGPRDVSWLHSSSNHQKQVTCHTDAGIPEPVKRKLIMPPTASSTFCLHIVYIHICPTFCRKTSWLCWYYWLTHALIDTAVRLDCLASYWYDPHYYKSMNATVKLTERFDMWKLTIVLPA